MIDGGSFKRKFYEDYNNLVHLLLDYELPKIEVLVEVYGKFISLRREGPTDNLEALIGGKLVEYVKNNKEKFHVAGDLFRYCGIWSRNGLYKEGDIVAVPTTLNSWNFSLYKRGSCTYFY